MKLTGHKSQCPACKRVFSTTSNFDKHRRGRHGIDRHCADPSAVGLFLSESGVWKGPPRIMPGEV